MKAHAHPPVEIPAGLLEAIRAFPYQREAEHCGRRWTVSPFDFYATCPHCGARRKLRSMAAVPELEDVFDAVFEWMNQSGAEELVARRRREIEADTEE
jgi:hypothetical protein